MILTANPDRARITLKPVPASRGEFIDRAMIGRMQPEDMAYMARALLQLADENAEMRERIRVLEARQG